MATMTSDLAAGEEEIGRWLAAARETVASISHCWLATRGLGGGANARTVRISPGASGGDEWTRRFLCRRGSRKVAEMRNDPGVTLAYQSDTGNAYVALVGRACLVDDLTEMRSLWPAASDKLFPAGFADANMMVVRVDVDRIEIHVRGVTREPFGYGRTLVEREPNMRWRFVPA
jgi:general stress protein 26